MGEKTITRVVFTALEAPKRKRVAAYARVSSGKDAMRQSLSAQVSYYSSLIQKHKGWEYAGVYADEGKTGTKDSRENFQRLINDCRAGRVDLVLTKSISRFARNTVTLLKTVRELKDIGIDVYFEEQNIHTLSVDGELMLTILASYAQEESLSNSENQKWRIKKNFKEGKPWACTLLGYRYKDGKYFVMPKEAETVRLIFSLYLNDGLGKIAIAKRLNSLGLRTRQDNEWHMSSVGKILCNEKYVGDLLLQKTFTTDYLTKTRRLNRGELPMYRVENNHEPIIDRETFNKVQEKLKLRALIYQNQWGSRSVFTGKLRCGICGKNYHRKKTAYNVIWRCATFNIKGVAFCDSKAIPEDTLFKVCADVLGLDTFDESVFKSRVDFLTMETGNRITFHFKNGTEVKAVWKDHSQAQSRTDEMKAKAEEKTRARYGKWQKQ